MNAATHQHQATLNRAYVFDALGDRTSSTEGAGVGGLLEVKATNGLRIYPFQDGHGNITSCSDI